MPRPTPPNGLGCGPGLPPKLQIRKLHPLATGVERTVPSAELAVHHSISRDGRLELERFIDSTNGRSELRISDASTGAEVRRLVVEPPRHFAQLTPDSASVLIFVGQEGHAEEVRTWDLATGAVTSRPLSTPPGITPRGFHLWLPSPAGRTLAYFDGVQSGFRLWDVATDRGLGGLLKVPGSQATISPGAWTFTPDGRFFLTGQDDGRVAVWDVNRQVLDRILAVQGPGDVIDDLVLSPDGRSLAAAGFRPPRGLVAKAVWLAKGHVSPAAKWRSTRATVLVEFPSGRRLARADGAVQPLFSPDGRRLALREWDAVSIRPFPGASSASP